MTERDNREAEAAGIDKNGSFLTDEPWIAEENGDVLYFDSAQFASEYIEAIDVGNGEYPGSLPRRARAVPARFEVASMEPGMRRADRRGPRSSRTALLFGLRSPRRFLPPPRHFVRERNRRPDVHGILRRLIAQP